MTAITCRDLLRRGELTAVNFLMTLLALHRRGAEIYVDQLGFHRRRFVTLTALDCPMRSHKRKLGLRMVELRQIFPRLCRMASRAAQGLTVSASLLHSFVELPVVNILMATGAEQRLPAIERGRLDLRLGPQLIGDRRGVQHSAR